MKGRIVILEVVARPLYVLILAASVWVLLRGHNEPGGGFIGGLIAASAFAIHGIAFGVPAVRRALYFHPMSVSGFGLLLAALSGFLPFAYGVSFLTGLWTKVHLLGTDIDLSTVMAFDIGVYLVVVGTMTSIALSLEDRP